MYILDTNVISELRKGKKAEQRVRMWAQALPAANLYLSVVSVLELEIGTLLVERRDRKQGAILRAWSAREQFGLDTSSARTCLCSQVHSQAEN
ncbi:MAG: PIN domain-containing protein, partial [Candidatus Sulfotelmatobacter sp.]